MLCGLYVFTALTIVDPPDDVSRVCFRILLVLKFRFSCRHRRFLLEASLTAHESCHFIFNWVAYSVTPMHVTMGGASLVF